jgi:hypothetical protein
VTAKVSEAFDFGELRSLLQQAPSEALWEQICALVFPAKWEKAADQWLPYAEDHLDRSWPDVLRVWPERWRGRKAAPRATQLVRHCEVDPKARSLETFLGALERIKPPLTSLDLSYYPQLSEEERGRLFAVIGSLEQLRRLRLGIARQQVMGALLESGVVRRLEALELHGETLDKPGVRALCASDQLGLLRELALEGEALTAQSYAFIAASPLPAQLESLSLRWSRLAGEQMGPPSRDESSGLWRLAQAEWPALERLDLLNTSCDRRVGALLARAPALRTLHMSVDFLRADALVGALEGVSALRELALSDILDRGDEEGLVGLFGLPGLAGLEVLTVGGASFGERAGAALRDAPCAQTLRHLRLYPAGYEDMAPGGAGLRVLCGHASPTLEQLRAALPALRGLSRSFC